jgi:DNA-binding IscR family transcriptional regulator
MDCFFDDRDGRVLCSHHSDGEHCATKLLWTRVQGGIARSLQTTTLAELVEFSRREVGRLPAHVTVSASAGASAPATTAPAV